jgi:transposase-like protein
MSENPNENEVVEERPSTEVVTRAARRRYTAEYKLRILREVEACKGTGEIGALLRREGLYSSNLTKWRQQRERGELEGLAAQRRGPKEDPQAVENARLKRENERLREELRKAQLIIEVQKKVSQLLGVPLEEPGEEDRSK